jgi:Flp pilus assembly pilin Flp
MRKHRNSPPDFRIDCLLDLSGSSVCARSNGAHGTEEGGERLMELNDLAKREDGQTMAEYGVVLAVITIGVVAAIGVLSGAIDGAIRAVAGLL